MTQFLASILLSVAIPAVAQPAATRTTAKAVEPFAQCFTAAQDRASKPWSFVPRESGGGTFSNAGAAGVRNPYFVEVADRGATRVIRLTSAGADGAVLKAVDACI
jgi:hypothetical protein